MVHTDDSEGQQPKVKPRKRINEPNKRKSRGKEVDTRRSAKPDKGKTPVKARKSTKVKKESDSTPNPKQMEPTPLKKEIEAIVEVQTPSQPVISTEKKEVSPNQVEELTFECVHPKTNVKASLKCELIQMNNRTVKFRLLLNGEEIRPMTFTGIGIGKRYWDLFLKSLNLG